LFFIYILLKFINLNYIEFFCIKYKRYPLFDKIKIQRANKLLGFIGKIIIFKYIHTKLS
jgi:hypothetical protein